MNISAYEGNQPYIFVSYAHKDVDTVTPIIKSLVASGYRVWYDAGIEVGTEWPEYIATKLSQSSCVIAFISNASLESQNCRREINYAISQKKEVLSIYLEDVELSKGMEMQLGTTQAMFYNRLPWEDFIKELVTAQLFSKCSDEAKLVIIEAPKTKKWKKWLVLASIVLFFITATLLGLWFGFYYSATSSKGLSFEFDAALDGYVVIGVGTCTDLDVVIPKKYNGKPVICIGDRAFLDCRGIESIVIPDSVTKIGSDTFSGCNSLRSITLPFLGSTKAESKEAFFGYIFGLNSYMDCDKIPKSIKKVVITSGSVIGDYGFYGCSSVTSIELPNGITRIGDSAFKYCHNLTQVEIPDSVKSIGRSAFSNCYNLKSIRIPNSVTMIGDYSFRDCYRLTNITLGNAVARIGTYAFSGCKMLENIEIPTSVTNICKNAFENCNFTSVTIPENVKSIGENAFSNCQKLTRVTIPDSVKTLGSAVFEECSELIIYCEAKTPAYFWAEDWNIDNRPVVWGYQEN